MAEPLNRYGPMHGERTRRHQFVTDGHQFVTDGLRGETVVSIHELEIGGSFGAGGTTEIRLNIEFARNLQSTDGNILGVDLTAREVTWLAEACAEYLTAHPTPPEDELTVRRREQEDAARERHRQDQQDLDDLMVKVSRDLTGPRASRALRVGLDILNAGGSQQEADQAIHDWLTAHPLEKGAPLFEHGQLEQPLCPDGEDPDGP